MKRKKPKKKCAPGVPRKPRAYRPYGSAFTALYATDDGFHRRAWIKANVVLTPKVAIRYATFFLQFALWAESKESRGGRGKK